MQLLSGPLSRREVMIFIGGIFLLAFIVFGRSLWNDFVYWDDPLLILENPISQGLSLKNIALAFSHYDPELYVPLTFLSFQLNYAVAGLHPFIYHLTNLLLHAGSAVLVGWVLFQLCEKKSVALVASLLFLVHPLNVEAIAWASARKDVLASFFFLLAFGLFLFYNDRRDRRLYVLSVAAFLVGLLSKASILVLPLVLLLTDWYRGKLCRASLLRSLPYFGLSIIFGIVALYGKTAGDRTLFEKILLGMKGTMFSLWHLFFPFGYSVIYPYDLPLSLENVDLVLPLAAVLAISLLTVLFRTRFPSVTYAWLFFLLLLIPSFFTVEKGGDRVGDLYFTSDRYAYVASIGMFFAAALLVDYVQQRNRAVAALSVACVLSFLAVLSHRQSLAWANTETLFRHALTSYPDSYVAHNNLGAFYEAQEEPERALAEYLASVQAKENGFAYFNLGQLAMKSEKSSDAIALFSRAVELRPTHHIAQLNLGALLLEANRPEEAIPHLLKAQSIDPKNVITYLNLGMALEKVGNALDAKRAYERALELEPGNAKAEESLKKLSR